MFTPLLTGSTLCLHCDFISFSLLLNKIRNLFKQQVDMSMKNKDYGSWTLQQLRNELRLRNAKLEGRKMELVDRLVVRVLYNASQVDILNTFCSVSLNAASIA